MTALTLDFVSFLPSSELASVSYLSVFGVCGHGAENAARDAGGCRIAVCSALGGMQPRSNLRELWSKSYVRKQKVLRRRVISAATI